MTERLHRVHAILRAGNVPCAFRSLAGLGEVLLAGTPNQGPWDILIRETDGEVWIHDAGETVRLPPGFTDVMMANAIKVRVVQAWADQGDPEAQALIAMLKDPSQPHHSAYRVHTPDRPEHVSPGTMQFIDPLQLVADVFTAANRLGWAFLTGRPAYVSFTLPSAWGTYQSFYSRR